MQSQEAHRVKATAKQFLWVVASMLDVQALRCPKHNFDYCHWDDLNPMGITNSY